jgi:purine-binding chemotaxis protein CheW
MRIVCFEVGDQDYALDVASLVGVASSSIEARPKASDPLLCGVQLFRNERAPVVSLRARFGLQDTARPQARILFVEIDDSVVGLRVDVLHATHRVLRGEIEPIPPRLFSEHAVYMRGAVRTDDRLTLLIDADRLLSTDEKALLARSVEQADIKDSRASLSTSFSAHRIAPL